MPEIPNFDEWVATRKPKPDVESALNLISKYESGGRNIKQQVVPPGGGYNPSVGRVTGPSTAGGPWQITNSTWQKRAPREIVQKYPTAMHAPVDVQRAVAGKIFSETGFQDWAPYNAALRRAIARGETGRSPTPQPRQPVPDQIPDFDTWSQGQQEAQPPQPRVRVSKPASPWGTGPIGRGVKPTRIAPRGISAARVEGEARPSEATATRGALRNIAASAGLPTGIPSQAGDLINEAVYQGAGQLLNAAGGVGTSRLAVSPITTATELLANRAGISPSRILKQGARQIAGNVQAVDEEANRGVVSSTAKDLIAGSIGSSPAMILTALGVPAPVAFGLQSNLEAEGSDASFKDVVKETAKGATIGALFELPLPVKQELLTTLQQRLLRAGIVGSGTAALTGSPTESLINAAFGATGGKGRERTTEARPETAPVAEPIPEVGQAQAPEVGAVRHVDLQRRLDDGKFAKEKAVEAEARRAQVSATPEPSEAAVSPAELPPEAAQRTTATTAPIPEIKTPKLALGVEAKAVERKLTEGFSDLPEYDVMRVREQAQQATDLLKSNPERAHRIAMGTEDAPSGLRPEAVFTAVENRALEKGDVETLQQLASSSTLPSEATAMGQRIRLLGERNPSSAVAAIRDVQQARESRVPNVTRAKKTIHTEIKVELRRAAPKPRDWASFLETIKCK